MRGKEGIIGKGRRKEEMDDRKKTERVYLHPVDPQFKQLLGGKERKG